MKNYYQKRIWTTFARGLMLLSMLLLVASTGWAQSKTVRGNIKDNAGNPAIGAAVVVKGTTAGTTANAKGDYSITVPSNAAVLVISFLGYETQEIPVGTRTVINATLGESSQVIDQVVVVGYGTVRKSDVTGAITQVNMKTIQERPVADAINAAQGKAAGVDVVSNVRPGEVPAINIRGKRSLEASNDPLYVVDGVILMGTMNDINPNDISSMEILKDAASTAIYGSRGANGVVLITTKKGGVGRLAVEYSGNISFDNINSTTKWASAGEMMDRMRLAEINGSTYKLGTTPLNYPNPDADIAKFGNSDPIVIDAIKKAYSWDDDGSLKMRTTTQAERDRGLPAEVPQYNPENIPTTDWIGMLTRVGITHNHLVSVTAGNEKSSLYTSIGYLNNEGTQKNQGFTRYTVRMNGDITARKWLKLGTTLNTSFTEQQYGRINRSGSATGANDFYGVALTQYVMAQPFDANGNMIDNPGNNLSAPLWNPYIDLENSDDLVRTFNLQANAYADVTFTPFLKYRLNVGSGYRTMTDGRWQGSQSTLRRKGNPQTAAATFSNEVNMEYLVENILFFNKTIDIHDFGVTLVQSAQKQRMESSFINADKIFYDSAKWFDLKSNYNGNPSDYGSDMEMKTIMSYMFRANYGLMGRYLATFSVRRDGSSVLAAGNKWDTFPAFALGWKINEEEFMKPVKWVSELKLRAGYGVTGNSSVAPNTTGGPLARYNYAFGDIPAVGMNPYDMSNPLLSWEKSEQFNLGLDFSLLNRRLGGTMEVYMSNTNDLLMNRSVIPTTGFVNILYNTGKIRNKGFELTLSSVNVQNSTFRWTTDFNYSTNSEEFLELAYGKQDMKSDNRFIGYPRRVFRTYELAGLWQNTPEDLAEIAKWKANGYNFEPGQYRPREQGTPNYKLEDDDKVIVGSDNPKAVLGLTNNFTLNNWEFSFFVFARLGQKYFSSLIPGGSTGGNYVGYGRSVSPSEFWSPTNPGGKYPQPTTNPAASNADVNRASFVNSGSFFAVRNISFAYNFPSKALEKMKIQRMQVYAQIMNPMMFGGAAVKAGLNPDDTNGWTSVNSVGDPTGGNNNNTMMITSFALGLRVGF